MTRLLDKKPKMDAQFIVSKLVTVDHSVDTFTRVTMDFDPNFIARGRAQRLTITVIGNAAPGTPITSFDYHVLTDDDLAAPLEGRAKLAKGSAILIAGQPIADGDELMSVSKLVPDFDNLANNMTATLTLEQYPQSSNTVTTSGTISSTTEKIDVRGRGRAVKIKYETNTVGDTPWRLGSTKLQLRPDGRR